MLKLITWNCNMAYRKKAQCLVTHKPDIVIVPECENPANLKFPPGTPLPADMVWHGLNPNKGLGVFSYSDYRFRIHESFDPAYRNVIPIIVTRKKLSFTLFAIWAYNPEDKGYQYIGQVWKALRHYDALLSGKRTILAGDFNSNTIWDKPRRTGNHSHVVDLLKTKKIYSTYHHFYKQQQGLEEHNTLFMYRHPDKAYHIDYCFASKDLIRKLSHVEIGEHAHWSTFSDHVPLIASFGN
jgi:exodeoxyribonuclease III